MNSGRCGANFIRQVIALEPAVDQAFGESSQLHYHSPVLQQATAALFAALAGWRAIISRLCDHVSEEPSGVLAQSNPRIKALISPPFAGQVEFSGLPYFIEAFACIERPPEPTVQISHQPTRLKNTLGFCSAKIRPAHIKQGTFLKQRGTLRVGERGSWLRQCLAYFGFHGLLAR